MKTAVKKFIKELPDDLKLPDGVNNQQGTLYADEGLQLNYELVRGPA